MIGWIERALQEKKEAQTIPVSLFARDELNGVAEIKFDLMTDESHALEFDVSSHPVDDGSIVTDHVRVKPRSCSVTGIFSCHPVGEYSEAVVNIDDNGSQAMTNRAKTQYEALETLAKKMEPVRLVTDLIVYPKMLVSKMQTKRDKGSGESVTFTMTLVEYNEVSLQQISSDGIIAPANLDTDDNKMVSPTANAGRVSGETPDADELAADFTDMRNVGLK